LITTDHSAIRSSTFEDFSMSGRPSQIGAFTLDSKIGAGSFGSVWKATHSQLKQVVAIKVIAKSSLSDIISKTRLQREIAFLKTMDHPFIAPLFQILETPDNYALVMEYAENGNLYDYIRQHGRMPEDQARRYFAQLISVLEYLHKDIRVAHRDLKPQNILLDRHNHIRLIDFGLSNVFTEQSPQFHSKCGSPAYLAPEVVKGQSYTANADLWSAGAVLFTLVAGVPPFEDEQVPQLLQKVVFTDPLYPAFFTPPLVNLLQKMMCKEPERRVTLDMIKNHPWFSLAEYAVLQYPINFRAPTQEGPIDREVIDEMTALGVDCRPLSGALLLGEYTDLTALYRIFTRERRTEQMKNVMQKMRTSGSTALPGPRCIARPLPVRPADRRRVRPGTPGPGAGKPAEPETLGTPNPPRNMARRSSKPAAVAQGGASVMATPVGVSHETP
jgi:serine/threonine protein kinase